jgi:xanthine dehydrogenase accessory factor
MIIAVVGAGGKTTRIHQLADNFHKQGKKVLVTTTTHMRREANTLCTDDSAEIIGKLNETGYCMVGQPASENKICALSYESYEKVCEAADVVLVEADGARGKLVKLPRSFEPVIPQNADKIEIIVNLSALGKICQEAAMEPEVVQHFLGIEASTPLKAEHLQRLVREGYLQPLQKQHPNMQVQICPNEVNGLYRRAVAALLQADRDISILQKEWFQPCPKLVICGGGHVADYVARFGQELDFEITVVDDRPEFVTEERFPMANRFCLPFSHVSDSFPQEDAYYVVVTRGHLGDRACVEAVLKRSFTYLGMIGSRGKVAKTMETLKESGYVEDQLSAIHAPIGLKIGAQTPAEIAISILAEIIAVRWTQTTGTLSAQLEQAKEQGVLCVLTEKHGSSPRGEGSMMLVTKHDVMGSIGGGALEKRAIEEAKQISNVCEKCYDLSASQSANLGMICGGSNKILFIPLNL